MSVLFLMPALRRVLALDLPTPLNETRGISSSFTPYLTLVSRGLMVLLASGLKMNAISFIE